MTRIVIIQCDIALTIGFVILPELRAKNNDYTIFTKKLYVNTLN